MALHRFDAASGEHCKNCDFSASSRHAPVSFTVDDAVKSSSDHQLRAGTASSFEGRYTMSKQRHNAIFLLGVLLSCTPNCQESETLASPGHQCEEGSLRVCLYHCKPIAKKGETCTNDLCSANDKLKVCEPGLTCSPGPDKKGLYCQSKPGACRVGERFEDSHCAAGTHCVLLGTKEQVQSGQACGAWPQGWNLPPAAICSGFVSEEAPCDGNWDDVWTTKRPMCSPCEPGTKCTTKPSGARICEKIDAAILFQDTKCGNGICARGIEDCVSCPSDCCQDECDSRCYSTEKCCIHDSGNYGICVDTDHDNQNCGGCNNRCAFGSICSAGTCCPSNQMVCDAKGTCVDTQTDESNCGNCGNPCAADKACLGGICCASGEVNCNGFCKKIFGEDPTNCGACGKVCLQGEQTCSAGRCKCGGSDVCSNGLCPDTNAQATPNCGTCGKSCPGQICKDGKCASCKLDGTSCEPGKDVCCTQGYICSSVNPSNCCDPKNPFCKQ
jgi:hypothetical protein